jgi:hypothetical protein
LGAADSIRFDLQRNALHDREAAARLPGPDFYEVLGWLHEELKPASYVEIGVMSGESLKLASPPTLALGIDPAPIADQAWRTSTRIVPLTSTEFFARHDLAALLGMPHFSLAFIDGLHLFEQAIEDLYHLERYAAPDSLIAVHDTVPLDEETSGRQRRHMFHTGDVWKLIPFLACCRPDLDVITVRSAPSGLTLIRRLKPCGAALDGRLRQFSELSWDYYQANHEKFQRTIPSDHAALLGWLSHCDA